MRYDLKTNREKNKIIENFAKYLKVAPKSMQIKSISVNADLSGIIKDSEEIISMEDNEKCRVLQQDEIEYLKQVKSHSVTRRYYIIYKVENVANTVDESIKAINVLNGYYMTAQHYLSNCGLSINEYSKTIQRTCCITCILCCTKIVLYLVMIIRCRPVPGICREFLNQRY